MPRDVWSNWNTAKKWQHKVQWGHHVYKISDIATSQSQSYRLMKATEAPRVRWRCPANSQFELLYRHGEFFKARCRNAITDVQRPRIVWLFFGTIFVFVKREPVNFWFLSCWRVLRRHANETLASRNRRITSGKILGRLNSFRILAHIPFHVTKSMQNDHTTVLACEEHTKLKKKWKTAVYEPTLECDTTFNVPDKLLNHSRW